MRKYLYIAVVMFFSAVSCRQWEEIDIIDAGLGENLLTAFIAPETRTTLGEKEGDTYDNLWAKDDRIAVFIDGAGDIIPFTLKEGAGTTKAIFSGSGHGSRYTAVYPLSAVIGIDGHLICLQLPSEQIYADSSFGPGCFPMVATSSSENLSFKNLCAVLKISMTGNSSIESIRFKALGESVYVTGQTTVDVSDINNPLLAINNGSKEIILTCSEEVRLHEKQPTDFHIVVPAQTYTDGFQLIIRSSEGTMIKKISQDVVFKRSEMRAIALDFEITEGIMSTSLSGEGSAESPFLISNYNDMLLLREAVNNAGYITSSESGKKAIAQAAHYLMTDDIDMAAADSWTPIGVYSSGNTLAFQGIFDGGGHAITNLHITSEADNIGLFGDLVAATVRNLTVSGKISGTSYVGLISGHISNGIIDNCKTYGQVQGSYRDTGGMIGWTEDSDIVDCANHADINGYAFAGGIIGYAYHTTVANCANYGSVSYLSNHVSNYTAGIVAYLGPQSNIYNCCNHGSVTGWKDIGGIVGMAAGSANDRIVNCYNTGVLSASGGNIGGIVGINNGYEIINCLNIGSVSVHSNGQYANSTGGIVGSNSGMVTNGYWLSSSGPSDGIGTDTGKTGNIFALSKKQMESRESTGMSLYTAPDGTFYTILTDALNAWAADNTDHSAPYYGWDYNGSDYYPTFTGKIAKRPGGGSSEDLFHSFTVLHANRTFDLPLITGFFANALVDWGDGTVVEYEQARPSHTYASEGEHRVTISAENAVSFKIDNLVGVDELVLN